MVEEETCSSENVGFCKFTERSCCNPSLGVVIEDRDEDIVTFMEFVTFEAGLVKVGE